MNRLFRMVLLNIFRVPAVYGKLRGFAKHPERYPEQTRWDYVRHVMELAVRAGNVELQVTGVENLPQEPGFMLYGNHQGMFDVVAIAHSCPRPLVVVYTK